MARLCFRCAATCGVCTTACEDKSKDCLTWASEGQCDANSDAMMITCPQVSHPLPYMTDGLTLSSGQRAECSPPVHPLCPPQACGLCHKLELFYRSANGGPDKDEL